MLWTLVRNFLRKSTGAGELDTLIAQGTELLSSGRFSDACSQLSVAHQRWPQSYEAAYGLGVAQARSGKLAEAAVTLRRARAIEDTAAVNDVIGNVERLRGRLADAVASYRAALGIDADHVSSLVNLGLTLRDLGEPREALTLLDRAVQIAPGHVEALFNRALVLNDLGRIDECERLIERALELDPEFSQAHLRRAFALLARRNFAEGWREYAWRVRIPEVDHWQDFPYPLWQGEPLAGKRLLVQAEQGLGDQIMFASCLNEVIERARDVVIECDPRLAKLFAHSFPSARIYRHRVDGAPDWAGEAPFDFRARGGDLPRMLRNREEDFPQHRGYLRADSARMAEWRQRLQQSGPGLKIGIAWRGGTPATGEKIRSMSLDTLLPVLVHPSATFVSLQYGDVGHDIEAVRRNHGVQIHQWVSSDGALQDVAALIACLDVVITVCSTPAHLAGALGTRGFVMVPTVAEWRYLAAGDRMPWYPGLQLFRESRSGEWGDVVGAICIALKEIESHSRA